MVNHQQIYCFARIRPFPGICSPYRPVDKFAAPSVNRLQHRDLATFIDVNIWIGSNFHAIYFDFATFANIRIYIQQSMCTITRLRDRRRKRRRSRYWGGGGSWCGRRRRCGCGGRYRSWGRLYTGRIASHRVDFRINVIARPPCRQLYVPVVTRWLELEYADNII